MAAVELVEVGGMPDGPAPAGESFLDPLVARLSAQYGLDPRAVGSLAVQVLASFVGARVRALVPVPVGKRLRDMCCGLSGLGPISAAYEESAAVVG